MAIRSEASSRRSDMLIRQTCLQGIATGAISEAFRRWRVPTVKTGGTLRTAIGVLAIDAVDVVSEDDITEAMAAAAGYPCRESLLAELARRPEGRTYRIRLHLAGPDPRQALREQGALSDEELLHLQRTLHRLDHTSTGGPWTVPR